MNKSHPSKLIATIAVCAAGGFVWAGPIVAQDAAQTENPQQASEAEPTEQLAARSIRAGERLGVDQIVLPKQGASSDDFQIKPVASDESGQAQVGQLPGDLEVPDDDGKSPESAISQPIQSPEAALFGRVAEAWQVIRERGQQPTPELIAREIGPDQLATFLDQNPAATDIFGQDSDTLPIEDVPGLEQLPDGGIFLIPPQGG